MWPFLRKPPLPRVPIPPQLTSLSSLLPARLVVGDASDHCLLLGQGPGLGCGLGESALAALLPHLLHLQQLLLRSFWEGPVYKALLHAAIFVTVFAFPSSCVLREKGSLRLGSWLEGMLSGVMEAQHVGAGRGHAAPSPTSQVLMRSQLSSHSGYIVAGVCLISPPGFLAPLPA